jgi:hypothetical protein
VISEGHQAVVRWPTPHRADEAPLE